MNEFLKYNVIAANHFLYSSLLPASSMHHIKVEYFSTDQGYADGGFLYFFY